MKKQMKLLIAGCVLTVAFARIPFNAMADQAATQSSNNVAVVTSTSSDFANIAISKVSDYVNVRAGAGTNTAIVGKIYNHCAATILETVDGEGGKWYKIQSGNVNGYIKAQFFVTGDEAKTLADEVGTEYAVVQVENTLNLREKPDLTSQVLTKLAKGARYVVTGEEGNFYQITVDSDLTGYVSRDYIKTEIEFDEAISLEEEAAKKAEAAERKKEADQAIKQLEEVIKVEAKKDNTTSSDNVQTTAPKTETAKNDTAKTETTKTDAAKTETDSSGATKIDAAKQDTSSQTSKEQTTAPTTANAGDTNNTVVNPNAGSSASTGSSSSSSTSTSTGSSSTVSAAGPGVSAAGTMTNDSKVSAATRTAIVAYAKQFLGNPYVYGGTSLTNGTDCSGFTQAIYAHFGIAIGRSSRDQAANEKGREISESQMQPGDLLFYSSGNYINHVAMYIGNGQLIHASTPKTGITISPVNYRTPCKIKSFLN